MIDIYKRISNIQMQSRIHDGIETHIHDWTTLFQITVAIANKIINAFLILSSTETTMCAAMSDLQHEEKIAWYLINYDSNKRYKINIGRLTIGSDLTNHVICQTRCPPHVSPEHCYIELFSDGTIFLTDMVRTCSSVLLRRNSCK